MYSKEKISKVLNCSPLVDGDDFLMGSVSLDSRTVTNPSKTLFFAVGGSNHNGHDFIPKLYKIGCRAFVVEEWRDEFATMMGANFWRVASSVKALQLLASSYRRELSMKIVAVAGSNGKTIVKEWLYQILSGSVDVFRSPRSYNSQIGVPLSVLAIPESADVAVIEAGISLPGEMFNLKRIIEPRYGIFTNIGDAHGENFANQDEKLKEKLSLFVDCDSLVCKSGVILPDFLKSQLPNVKLMMWGYDESCDIQILNLERKSARTMVELKYADSVERLSMPFIDEASFENCMNVVTMLCKLGIPFETIAEGVKSLQPVAMRMEIKQGVGNSLLIQDYYNSDPESFKMALQSMQLHGANRRRVVVLSDFVGISRNGLRLYGKVANQLVSSGVSLFIGIGKELSSHRALFHGMECRFYESTDEFLKVESTECFNNSVVLLKGARKYRFEYIAAKLQQQAHKTVLEVDLDAMRRNLNHFRSLVPASTKFAVMVKAFTYGCGGAEIASMLQYQGVDYLMVAFADEGIELRSAGISTHIGVMNPESETFDKMVEFNLEPEIFSMDMLREFDSVAQRHGAQNYPIHIKLNSGMNRSGFDREELDELLQFFNTKRAVKIVSIFSHLAGADEACHDAFTLEQIERFDSMSNSIIAKFDYKIVRHILNSAGIERFPQYHYDMVRLGIGIHGISAAGAILEPVATFKTHIAAIRNVKSSESVGYGRKGELTRDSRVAVILVGYADGLDRHLSCGVGEMCVRGHRVPILGNICMDACMLDVTDFPDIEVGDEVEIFGKSISIVEIADKLNTIPYEVITGISRRVRRLFFKE